MRNFWQSGSDSDRLAWPILLLLLTVFVPSVGVVWMMREAVRNERLATSQRLREAYQAQLESAKQTVQGRWVTEFRQLAEQVDQQNPAESFATIVSAGFFDSVLIVDEQGQIVYPAQAFSSSEGAVEPSSEWRRAESLEFSKQQHAAAAEAYAKISREDHHAVEGARARQAQVRCLLRIGAQASAIEVLQAQREQDGLHDEQGRSFAAAAELHLLHILDHSTELWEEVGEKLAQRLGDYRTESMSASQRRFFMTELRQLIPEISEWPTQAAEEMAAETVAALGSESKSWYAVTDQLARQLAEDQDDSLTSSDREMLIVALQRLTPATRKQAVEASEKVGAANFFLPRLQTTSVPNIWSQASSDGRLVGLLRTSTIRNRLLLLTEALPLPSGVALAVIAPQETSEHLMAVSLGENLADWRLALSAAQGDPFDATSQQRSTVHLWIALLVIALTCVLAWLLASALRRRLRLARLKNDLVATVSHELKTPLASIRLLVDTLLESDDKKVLEHSQLRDYLELISQENARLTRLIDNFLQFSRMERNMQRFDFQVVCVQEVVRQAAAVFREHCDNADDFLQINEGKEAWISGDLDTLVTAVVNLLENAWKYSGEQKQIVLTADTGGDYVKISIRDNGIGLTTRAASRAFDRFYQVDQRVARTEGGCGLGLSIVRAIVKAHGGEVRVESRPAEGSTFTICLPQPTQGTLEGD